MESGTLLEVLRGTRSQENLVDTHLVVSAPGRALSSEARR